MKNLIEKKLKEKGFLIAAHRGTFGANIMDNTYLSMKLALDLGADMVEVDVVKSKDGILYAFHSGKEKERFKKDIKINLLNSEEISKLEYYNLEGGPSGRGVEKLEDILVKLKGDNLINIDRAWDYFPEVFELIKKLGMENQIIIKAREDDEVVDFLDSTDLKLMFMPIIRKKESLNKYLDKNINIVAVEVLFDSKEHELNSLEFKNMLKEKNILLWINTIKLDNEEKNNFSAGYTDDESLEENGKGWEWVLKQGANIIQTDWPYFLNQFRNKYYNK